MIPVWSLWNSRRRKSPAARNLPARIRVRSSKNSMRFPKTTDRGKILAPMTKRLLLLFVVCAAGHSLNAEEHVVRPKITGIAHVRLYVSDLEKSRQYYGQFLGFGPGTAGCLGATTPCYTVNAHQQIELKQITAGTPDNLLAEVAFTTTDAEELRRYVVANGISAGNVVKDNTGSLHFELTDPEGHVIAFVQPPSERFFTAKAN